MASADGNRVPGGVGTGDSSKGRAGAGSSAAPRHDEDNAGCGADVAMLTVVDEGARVTHGSEGEGRTAPSATGTGGSDNGGTARASTHPHHNGDDTSCGNGPGSLGGAGPGRRSNGGGSHIRGTTTRHHGDNDGSGAGPHSDNCGHADYHSDRHDDGPTAVAAPSHHRRRINVGGRSGGGVTTGGHADADRMECNDDHAMVASASHPPDGGAPRGDADDDMMDYGGDSETAGANASGVAAVATRNDSAVRAAALLGANAAARDSVRAVAAGPGGGAQGQAQQDDKAAHGDGGHDNDVDLHDSSQAPDAETRQFPSAKQRRAWLRDQKRKGLS